MTRHDFLKTGLATVAFSSIASANVVNSIISAKANSLMSSSGSQSIPYVKDGLAFIGEHIQPPSSGYQTIDLGIDIEPSDWTLEWCGVHIGNSRQNLFISVKSKPNAATSFGIGWWINNDGIRLNNRVYYSEYPTNMRVGEPVQLAYVVSDASSVSFYEAGQFSAANNSLVQSTIGQIGNPIRYVYCLSTDYCQIFSIRVYNRALTAEEIAFNATIDKARFGL